jgi:5-methylcytosine-specific restriction endonuclease McrA
MSKGQQEKIEVVCKVCETPRIVCRGTYRQGIKRNGFYRCPSCAPQRNKEFWQDPDRKASHSEVMRASENYRTAIARRDLSGEKNGMFGKKHSTLTISKMSKLRTGKIGKNATAWKGGKTSFTRRVKGLIETRHAWFSNVFQRDDYRCKWCGSLDSLDAHHIEPVVKIIERIIKDSLFESDDAKLEFVINHPDIRDQELENGITLCRTCHKKAHKNWGSHVEP